MDINTRNLVDFQSSLTVSPNASMGTKRSTLYQIECWRNDELVWTDEFQNLVVTEGLNDSLDKQFKASAYTAQWFVGLTTGTPVFAASDTLASHADWTEFTTYTGNRKTMVLGVVAAGSVSNTASRADFVITTAGTVGGAFVDTVATGTAGILYGGGAFSANRSVLAGDTISVLVTLSTTAS